MKISTIKEMMCTKYCQYPGFDMSPVMLALICEDCPLNELEDDE